MHHHKEQRGARRYLRSRWLLVAVMGVLVVLAITVNARESSEALRRKEKAASAPLSLPADVAAWRLPLSQKFVKSNSLFDVYGENIYLADCMSRLGVSISVPKVAPNTPLSPMFNTDLRRLFTPDVAFTYGYRVTGYYSTPVDDVEVPADAGDKWSGCLALLRKEYSEPPTTGIIQEIETTAYLEAQQDPAVRQAVDGWNKCMTAAGIKNLADFPDKMPTPQLKIELGIPDDSTGAPSSKEKAAAVKDANCRVTSGFYQAFHGAEASLQRQGESASQGSVDKEAAELTQYHEKMMSIASVGAEVK